MRKALAILTLTGIFLVTPALTPAAHAGGFGWLSVGTGFRVGGLNLSLVFGQPFGYGGTYYRFPRPIVYRGVHCTSRCFIDHGVYYHDRNCPLVGAYFRSYGYDPYQVYSRYAPSYDGYYDGYGGGYDGGGYYDGGYYDGGYYADPYYGGGYGGGYYGGGVVYYNRGYSRHYDHNRSYRHDGYYGGHNNGGYYGGGHSNGGYYGHGYDGGGHHGGYGQGNHGKWDGRHDGGDHGHGGGGGHHDGGKGHDGHYGHR